MNRILAVMKMKLLRLRHNYAMFLMLTVSPILFTLVIGNMNTGGDQIISIYIDDQDKSVISGELLKSVDPALYEIVFTDEATIVKKVRDKEIKSGYVIPPGFGQKLQSGTDAEINIIRQPDANSGQEFPTVLNSVALRIFSAHQTAEALTTNAERYRGSLTAAEKALVQKEVDRIFLEGWQDRRLSSKLVQVGDNTAVQTDMKAQSSMGYLVFFLMFVVSFNMTSIIDDKKDGTWTRILSTPTRPSELLAGHFLGTMVIGAIQVVLLVGFGSLVMGVQWGRSPLGVFLVLFALVFCLTALSLMLAGFVEKRRSMQGLYPVLIVSTSMLGGCMWPLEIVSDFMRTVAHFIPQGQAMLGLTDLIVRGGGVAQALPSVAALLGMGVLFFIVGVAKVKPGTNA